jgi:hypothetical protein
MDPTNQALNLWELQPLTIERKATLDSALELAQIEAGWVQVLENRYKQRNGNAPPIPELVVMIEHWTLQMARTVNLKERDLFPDETLYAFFMGAFALNKSNAEKVMVSTEASDATQRALKLAKQEAERTQHALKWIQSNAAHNLARLEQRVTETAAAAAFWTAEEAQARADWQAEDPEAVQAWDELWAAHDAGLGA